MCQGIFVGVFICRLEVHSEEANAAVGDLAPYFLADEESYFPVMMFFLPLCEIKLDCFCPIETKDSSVAVMLGSILKYYSYRL